MFPDYWRFFGTILIGTLVYEAGAHPYIVSAEPRGDRSHIPIEKSDSPYTGDAFRMTIATTGTNLGSGVYTTHIIKKDAQNRWKIQGATPLDERTPTRVLKTDGKLFFVYL